MSHIDNNDSTTTTTDDISQCPVSEEARLEWLKQNKSGVQNDNNLLSTEREISGIPRTGEKGTNWIYPSEQQFYDAMKRKKINSHGNEFDMKTVIPIHNNINERVWKYIEQWENLTSNDKLSLTSFKGDSKKITPRAWIRHYIFGMDLPFDRHDWIVNHSNKDNNSSYNINYVIDFYMNQSNNNIYLDVRPKINNYQGIKRRILKILGY